MEKKEYFPGCGWIWYDHYGYDEVNAWMQARREFFLETVPDSLLFSLTADTKYRLYVNERLAAFGPARGFLSPYPFDSIDIAPLLQKGKNVLAVLVHQTGHGTYQSIYGGAAGLIADGSVHGIALGTEPGLWLVRPSPGHRRDTARRSVQMAYQEHFDCRKDSGFWMRPESKVSAGKDGWIEPQWRVSGSLPWTDFEERQIPMLRHSVYSFSSCLSIEERRAAPEWKESKNLVSLHKRESKREKKKGSSLSPLDIIPFLEGNGSVTIPAFPAGNSLTLLFDAGEESTGFIGIKARANGGESIDFLFSEAVDKDGLVVKSPEYGCKVSIADRVTLRKGKNFFESFFYNGFRYCALTLRNVRKPLVIESLYLRKVGYAFDSTASFHSSDTTINAIWDICRRTQENCSFDAYVDCPWREQAQWWGDARIQGINTFYLFGDMRLFRRGILQGGKSQLANGLTYGHFPTMSVGSILPDFTFTWIHTVLDYYHYTGDVALVRREFPKVQKALNFFCVSADSNGMIAPMLRYWIFLDWAPLYKEGYSALFHMIWLLSLRTAVQLSHIAGEDGSLFQQEADALEEKILHYFWDPSTHLFSDGFDPATGLRVSAISQHTHAFAILLGLRKKDHRNFAEKVLLPPMKGKPFACKNIVESSPFFVYYVIEALKKLGGYDSDILQFIKRRWGNMVREGATTCHEMWNPEPGVISLCHAWSAHPAVHLVNLMAGIYPTSFGWKEFSLLPAPYMPKDLTLSIPTEYGDIHFQGKREGDIRTILLTVPKGSLCTVKEEGKEFGEGSHILRIR
ncbi:MAG: family 78 glycoside hydrolase catalytic domain [Candidatus Ratteibacteria bacterium]|jgi:alpha-L-rhamnosidase